jgi:D-amino-acid dehydrogenase
MNEFPRHVAVIGAGIVGVCTALYLQRDGHRVTLIDRLGPGEGTSKGNAAVIAAESCVPVATPGILGRVPGMLMDPLGPLAIRWRYLPKLAPWLWEFVKASSPKRVEEISLALRPLLVQAVESYVPLLKSAGIEDMLRRTGWLGVYETEKKFAAAQADFALQRRRGVQMTVLPAEEIRQFEPSLAPIYKHAVFFPENAYVTDNFRLVQALAESLVRNGGTLLKRRCATSRSAPAAPRTSSPTRRPRRCGGAHRRRLVRKRCPSSATPLPDRARLSRHVPRSRLRARACPSIPANTFAVTPLERLRIAGTVELGGLEAPPNYARARVLLERGRRMFPQLNETGKTEWMGFRPSMPDSVPVISASDRHRNAFFSFGHGHIGLTLGAVTGRVMADLVAGRDPGLDMRPYRIDRF